MDEEQNQPIEDQLATVLRKRGSHRLEAIVSHPNPRALVASMAKTEAFVSYGELGEEHNRRLLIHLLSDEQVDFLLDLDLWQGDSIAAESAWEWVDRLVGAGDDVALRWVHRSESELVVALLRTLIEVYEGPPPSIAVPTEASDQLPPFSAEGQYFIDFKNKESRGPLKRLLVLLAGHDLEYYLALVQEVLVSNQSEAMERAHEQRWERLRDEGFVPPEEAYAVYRWPTADELDQGSFARTASDQEEDDDTRHPAPSTLALAEPPQVLAKALGQLDDHQAFARFGTSVAHTAARLLAADHMPMGLLEAHKQALSKALGYVSLGLESRCGSDVKATEDALRSTSASALFRAGYAEVAALGRRATMLRRKGWLSHLGLGLEVLDAPLGEVVKTLARPRPQYPARALNVGEPDREFVTMDEVIRCRELLDQVDALGALFLDGLGLAHAPRATFDLDGCAPPIAELTLGLVLRTALAQLTVTERLHFAPLDTSALAELSKRLPTALGSLRSQALSLLFGQLDAPSAGTKAHIERFLDQNLETLFTSFEKIQDHDRIDPRFVGVLVIRHDH